MLKQNKDSHDQFKTQQEIWEFLSANENNKIIQNCDFRDTK